MKNRLLLLLSLMIQFNLFAESTVEMADVFRSNGKIYVVVATLSIILLCITYYLIRTEIKLSSLEKLIKGSKKN